MFCKRFTCVTDYTVRMLGPRMVMWRIKVEKSIQSLPTTNVPKLHGSQKAEVKAKITAREAKPRR